jgi:hypothetical protein
MGFEHNDVQWGALGSGFEHCDVQFGKTYNAATLEQSTGSTEVTWGTPPNNWDATGTNDWARAEFKLTPLDTRGNGNIRVTVYCVSGSSNSSNLRSGFYHDPDLTGDIADAGAWAAGSSKVMTGDAPNVYQTGYFCIDTGWASYSCVLKITKIEWQVSTQGYLTVWEEGLSGAFRHSCIRLG